MMQQILCHANFYSCHVLLNNYEWEYSSTKNNFGVENFGLMCLCAYALIKSVIKGYN